MENKLRDLLRIESERLQLEMKLSSLEGYGTPQEIADRREECLASILRKYFQVHIKW